MIKFIKIIALLSILVLNGCQTFKLVEPGKGTTLGNLSIQTERQWSQYNSFNKTIRILTRDGVLLNVVSVINVKNGQHIFKQRLTKQNKGFKFDKSLTIEESAELFLDGLYAANLHNVDVIDESESLVSNHPAIRLEYTYDTGYGLTYREISLIIKHDDQLEILNCFAPLEHYFPLLENEFNSIIASAKVSD